jgi:regulatory protein
MREVLDAAMRLLTRREHSAHQLRLKLKQRCFEDADIDEALLECARLDMQSDMRFAESFCRSRASRGYGPVRLAQELREAGVSSADASQVLDEMNHSMDWVIEATRVWQKKYHVAGRVEVLSTLEQQKQKQFLRYRGFTDEIIRMVFETCESCHDGYE